jgi:pimeloyl-ACP methyl ester carboxylesterase
MPIAAVNGQKIYYEDTGGEGGGDGPVVIFSHGLFMDHAMFAPQVEALKGRYRCITWDERGHAGTAGETLAPFTYYDSADDLAALLAHLGVKRAVLAGMSQGGFLSLRCALTHPEIVRALILIDTQAGQEDPTALEGHMALANAWAANGLSDEMASVIEGIILGDGWAGAPAWKAKWKTITPVNMLGCMQTLAGRDDVTGRLGEIKVPALVLHGDKDAAIDLALARKLAAGLGGGAELVVIPGGGHAANLPHPQVANDAIVRFLDGLGA